MMSFKSRLSLYSFLSLVIPSGILGVLIIFGNVSYFLNFLGSFVTASFFTLAISGILTIPAYSIGCWLDHHIEKMVNLNQDPSYFRKSIFRGAHIGLVIGFMLAVFIVIACAGGGGCWESFLGLAFLPLPFFFFMCGLFNGILWNYRWGRILALLLMAGIISFSILPILIEFSG